VLPAKRETITSETNLNVSVIVCRFMLIESTQATKADISLFQKSYSVFHCSIASSVESFGESLVVFVVDLSFSA
jgi:hypothetical protein